MRSHVRGKLRLAIAVVTLFTIVMTLSHLAAGNVKAAEVRNCYLSITLTVPNLSGPAPFTPGYNFEAQCVTYPATAVMNWGDGTSDNCGTVNANGQPFNCPSHTYYTPGTYTMEITITDATGSSASDHATITAYSSYSEYTSPILPASHLSITLTVTTPTGQAPFNLWAWGYSYTGAVEPVRLVIYWGDGSSNDLGTGCDNSCPSHTYTTAGTYTITIEVTDANGNTASDSKTVTVYAAPVSTPTSALNPPLVSLSVNPRSGDSPLSPTITFVVEGGVAPYTVSINFGDGSTPYVANNVPALVGEPVPPHTYASPGTYTIQVTSTDSVGNTASDSKTIIVYSSASATSTVASTSSSSPQGVTLIPAITVCNPTLTIAMLIITLIVAVLIVRVLTGWIIRGRPFRTRLIVAFIVAGIVWFFFGAWAILVPGGVCTPGIVWLLAIILITIVIWLFRDWLIGPQLPPPPPPPPRANVTGNATVTQTNGTRTQLNRTTLNQVGPGTSIETQKGSYVRVQTPQGARSETTMGENSSLGWLDPTFKTPIPWLRLPGPAQIYNIERLLLRLDFGKFLINWVEPAAEKEALVILPAGLIAASASEAARRWLARVKGTMVLFEAVPDGTSAAITVLESDDPTKCSSVEMWRSDQLKVIEIHPGERVILKTDQPPNKTTLQLAKGLTWDIEDPFRLLHKFWTLPPMSDETNAALTGGTGESGGTTSQDTLFCTNCSRKIPAGVKFCPYCAAEQPRLP